MTLPLQAGGSATPLSVAGTVGLFALFLSLTAHVAARNVLGDVPVRNAFAVGPLPAAIGFVSVTFGVDSYAALALAIVVDGAAIGVLYGRGALLTAYVTLIHFVVTVILGAVLFSLLLLLGTAPI